MCSLGSDDLVLRRNLLDRLVAPQRFRATRALKSAVNRRRVTIVVLLHYLAEIHLSNCPIFQDQLSIPLTHLVEVMVSESMPRKIKLGVWVIGGGGF